MSWQREFFFGLCLVAMPFLGTGCQQQLTNLSGWVTEGEESSIRILKVVEVELASAPVPGARVTVHKRDRGQDRTVGETLTDRTGRFCVTLLREPAGLAHWQLTVEKPGYQPAQSTWGHLPRRPDIYWRVDLKPAP